MPEDLWDNFDSDEYQEHVTISTIDSTTESKDADKRIVYIEDLEKRKQVYGICGECNEPEGGFSKVYSVEWPEGHIEYWDIENQKWKTYNWGKYALKSLNNSSDICSDFLNEIKSHLQIYLYDVVSCYGITQDPVTKEYTMVLRYCDDGNLRNCLNKAENYIDYESKINTLQQIARGLLDIHNSGLIHKDFHSAIKICSGLRPNISKDVPKLLAELIIKCWDAEIKNRPTTKELYETLKKWHEEENNELTSQIGKYNEIRRKNFESKTSEDRTINIRTHSQAIYTSRLLNFKNLPKPVNSSNLSSCQLNSADAKYAIQSTSANPISVQLDELELNEFWQN
ncbi:kinase-like domain-containing protein [Rhizophagus clarus]|uniref:Kinase-like domain-containing protein n=1 Tax=Rhizophagus clarus TaxID=94130 RepID=A0A8H3QPC1_9GLOM|nr:kinase-like domain-containing protein [Rhizophagus clarus]